MSAVPDERPEMDIKPAEPIPVAQFEGEFVRDMRGKLPAITLEMPEGYARGTHLKLEVEVRVRNVRYEEATKKPYDLVREHIFALEEVRLVSAHTAEELDAGVGGSASGSAPCPDCGGVGSACTCESENLSDAGF